MSKGCLLFGEGKNYRSRFTSCKKLALTVMPSLSKHPWSFRYLLIRIVLAMLIRPAVIPILWFRLRRISLEGIIYTRTSIPSRDYSEDRRSIKVEVYRFAAHNGAKPAVLINMHGYVSYHACVNYFSNFDTHDRRSGFVLPGLGSDRKFCRFMATHTNCVIFDIDYRKAPENPFPAALQDVQDIVFHLSTLPNQYDLSNIFLSGASAGGNLALSASITLGPDVIRGVIAAYPNVDCSKHYIAPEQDYASGGIITPWMADIYWDAYILPDQSRKDPRISPLFSPWESFPKHLYLACGRADTLYEPTAMLAQKLKDAGHKDVTLGSFEAEGHSFDKWAKEGTSSAVKRDFMYAEAADMIKRAMAV